MVSEIVEKTKSFIVKPYLAITVLNVSCPKCKGIVKETYKRYACVSCDFSISKTPGARLLSVSEAETFIREKKLGPLQGFRSKRGFLFAGTIVLTDDYKLIFDFESMLMILLRIKPKKKTSLEFVLNVLKMSYL